MTRRERTVDVLIVGAGAELAASGAGHVEVLEREQVAGGIPRHCFHGGFGTGRAGGAVTGPGYARQCVAAAVGAGARLRTGITVGQDGHVLHRQRLLLPAEPNRPFRLRADWLDRVDPHGGTVRITAV